MREHRAIQGLVVLVVLLALLGTGYWVRGVLAERDTLKDQSARQTAQIEGLNLQRQVDNQTLQRVQKAAQEARKRAQEAYNALASIKDPEGRAFLDAPLPGSVRDALRRERPTGAPGGVSGASPGQ